jgi:Zn-dependent protease
MRIKGVPVYVHWLVFLIWIAILIGAIERPTESLAAWAAYFAIILLHEVGHMVMAERLGYSVCDIELHAVHGLVHYAAPRSRYDEAAIAWGGVLMQLGIAIPLLILIRTFGFTRWDALNVLIGVLSYYSIFVAAINLLPIRPMDGARAWAFFPEYFRRHRAGQQKRKRVTDWR